MMDKTKLPKREGFDRWVYVDGEFAPELSDAVPWQANTLHACIIPAGVQLEKPVHLLQVVSQSQQQPVELSIEFQAGSKAAIWLENWSELTGDAIAVEQHNHIRLASNAVCQWVTCQHENGVKRTVTTRWDQAESSRLEWFYLGLVADQAHENNNVYLQGEKTYTRLRGLLFPTQKQKMALYTLLTHEQPNTDAQQVFRSVVADKALAELEGRVLVQPGADKTVSTQSYKSILLSSQAEAKTRPQLEIYADDVVCNHGASIGELEEKQLFYLRSRGIDKKEAQRLLLHGFSQALVNEVSHAGLQAELLATLESYWREVENGA